MKHLKLSVKSNMLKTLIKSIIMHFEAEMLQKINFNISYSFIFSYVFKSYEDIIWIINLKLKLECY